MKWSFNSTNSSLIVIEHLVKQAWLPELANSIDVISDLHLALDELVLRSLRLVLERTNLLCLLLDQNLVFNGLRLLPL